MSIEQARMALGAAQNSVAAWELEHGCRPNPEYHKLLRAAADAKSQLRALIAEKHGEWSWPIFAQYGH